VQFLTQVVEIFPILNRVFRLCFPGVQQCDQSLDFLKLTRHSFTMFLVVIPLGEIMFSGLVHKIIVSIGVAAVGPLGDNAAAIWATISRIQRIQLPPKDFAVPSVCPTALPLNAQRTRPVFVCGLFLYAIAFSLLIYGTNFPTLIGAVFFPALIAAVFATGMVCEGRSTPEFFVEKKRRRAVPTSAQLGDLIQRYNVEFDAKTSELKQVYQRYSGLDRERQTEMQRLERDKQQLEMNDFLRGQLISRASIPGIGNARKSRLLSFGIGSALDIRPNLQIPGFGPTNMSHLLNWRATCEARFRFDPNRPIPPVEIQRLNLKIAAQRTDLSSKLKTGPSTLTNLSAGAQGRYLQLTGQLEIAVRRRAQAQADCGSM
jgi:DNA-binding helix-hairpin-helix protein with protein kinase domain